MPASLFDSNVPLYLAAGKSAKADRAEALLSKGGVISVQVLNEIANVGLRKFGMNVTQVEQFLTGLRSAMRTVSVSLEIHELALWVRTRHRFAFYDCAIVAAALHTKCDTLWSEDMFHGLVIDGRLTIRNPFAA